MDLKQLEYFVRVAELGSFTRASVALNIAQPALSRQVRLLEVELRQNLLLRNGRGVTTTEAGRIMLEHARGVLHQVERAREELGRVRGTLVGRVALGLPPSLSKVLTVPLTRAFRTLMPEASLSITEGMSVTMQESLISGRLDIALLYNAGPSPEVELANLGYHPKIALEIDGVAAILDLVADGAGSAVLSMNAITASGKPASFSAHPIIKPRLRTKLSLAVSSHRPATLTQKAMLDLIRQVAGKLLK